MGLTGGGFIALLFVMVAVLFAFTVWWWPRGARSGPGTLAARIGLLVGTQAVTLLAVLVAVNAHFEFYSGWDDLFATNAAPAKIKHVMAKAGGPVKQIDTATIKRIGSAAAKRDPAVSGATEEYRFQGQATGLSAETFVLLPPQYYQPAYAKTKFPVVIVLTGYPGHPTALLHTMHFPELVRQGERAGVPPAIYVLMRPTEAPPRDTECADVPGGPQVESFFATDVPLAMAAHYRVAVGRSGWGIMGDSTGGFCATKIAMKHPDRYSAAASLSGYFSTIQDLTTGKLFDGNKNLANESNLLWREKHLPAPPISLLVASCRVGEKTFPENERFLAGIRPPMKADSLFLPSGGHNYRTFRRMVPATLRWFGVRLKAE